MAEADADPGGGGEKEISLADIGQQVKGIL
jgi:hypothetical protein